METSDPPKRNEDPKESEPKVYYVHNDIVFITGYVAIDTEEPLEIIQCYVDVEKETQRTTATVW